MLVVLEGSDWAGKTELAHRIEQAYHQDFLEMGRTHAADCTRLSKGPPDDRPIMMQYENDLERIAGQVLSTEALVICDRWHVGELVYGPQYRGESRLSEAQALHVDLFLDAMGAVKIFVDIGPKAQFERAMFREDHMVTVKEAYEIANWYRDWWHTDTGWQLTVGDDRNTVGQICHWLEQARRRAGRARYLNRFPGYVGSLYPETLLVGDTLGAGMRSDSHYKRAFTPARNGSSADYLFRALLQRPDRAHRYGIANANDPFMNIRNLWLAVGEHAGRDVAVIALGQKAHATLEKAKVPCAAVTHPQFWNRFHHADIGAYSAQLTGEAPAIVQMTVEDA